MKKDLHPTYYADAQVTCACGNSFTVGSTVKDLQIELCSNCHPFYTGKQKLVDTARRIEKFGERTAKKAGDTVRAAADKKAKEAARKAKKAEAKKK